MLWVVENGVHITVFNNIAQIHNGDIVGDFCHHTQVMGDEQDAHIVISLQTLHEVNDLGLCCHIQRRCRLIGNEQARVTG